MRLGVEMRAAEAAPCRFGQQCVEQRAADAATANVRCDGHAADLHGPVARDVIASGTRSFRAVADECVHRGFVRAIVRVDLFCGRNALLLDENARAHRECARQAFHIGNVE